MTVYGLIQRGYDEGYKPDKRDKDMIEIIGKKGEEGIAIIRADIPSFFDGSIIDFRTLYAALRIFNNYKRGFWPHTGGYMQQLYDVYRVAQMFEGAWYGQ